MKATASILAGVTLIALLASVAPVTAHDFPEVFEDFQDLADLEDAIAAGYLLITPCIPGMGFHYVNPAELPGLFAEETVIALLFHEDDLVGIEEVIFRPLLGPDEPPEGFEPIPEPPGLFGRHTFFETPPSFADCPLPPRPTPPVDPEGPIREFALLATHVPGGPFGFFPTFLESEDLVPGPDDVPNPSLTVTVGDTVMMTITNVDPLLQPHDFIIQDSEGEILVRSETTILPDNLLMVLPNPTATIVWNTDDEGTFWYLCEFHGLEMRGTITVEPED